MGRDEEGEILIPSINKFIIKYIKILLQLENPATSR